MNKEMNIFINGFINFKGRNQNKPQPNGENFNYYKWLIENQKASNQDFNRFAYNMQSIVSKL